jgi:Tetratricopeptide repeat/Poxvirus D5 protein-like
MCHQKRGNLREALSLAGRALKIHSQSLGDTHPKTVATRTLHAQLLRERADREKEMASEPRAKKCQNDSQPEPVEERATLSADQTRDRSRRENNPLQAFLNDCCELHPRAWVEAGTLWQAYEQWVEHQQERFPLSRRAFTAHLKAHGCQPGRTSTTRLWHGLTLREKDHDAT